MKVLPLKTKGDEVWVAARSSSKLGLELFSQDWYSSRVAFVRSSTSAYFPWATSFCAAASACWWKGQLAKPATEIAAISEIAGSPD